MNVDVLVDCCFPSLAFLPLPTNQQLPTVEHESTDAPRGLKAEGMEQGANSNDFCDGPSLELDADRYFQFLMDCFKDCFGYAL